MGRPARSADLRAWQLAGLSDAFAGQAPVAASDPDIPISHQDRVYSAEQYSNTVSVTDPVDNRIVGIIRLGDPLPANLSPLYKGQLLVHGTGFSPDHRTIAVVAIGSNAMTFIDTATNSVKPVTYVGRSPHEVLYTMDGKEVRVVVRGENYVSVLDGTSHEEKTRITVPQRSGHDDLLARRSSPACCCRRPRWHSPAAAEACGSRRLLSARLHVVRLVLRASRRRAGLWRRTEKND